MTNQLGPSRKSEDDSHKIKHNASLKRSYSTKHALTDAMYHLREHV